MNKAAKLMDNLRETADSLRTKIPAAPEVALILGSGLGPLADRIEDPVVIPYEEIPHFPRSTVVGHSGVLVFGTLSGKRVVALKGRFHLYEGWQATDCVYPVRVFRQLGCHTMVVSNAAGGVNRHFREGDLMLIEDIINFQFTNPLIGPNDDDLGGRFPDMSQPFSKKLLGLAEEVALENKVCYQKGVYWANTGPTYETRAELRLMGQMGADAVGMSTVPEVIAAVHCGYQDILGISCITNLATGEDVAKPNHQEVLDTAKRVEGAFCDVVSGVLARI
jgi:purine-nucleoside phosphorylase